MRKMLDTLYAASAWLAGICMVGVLVMVLLPVEPANGGGDTEQNKRDGGGLHGASNSFIVDTRSRSAVWPMVKAW